MKKINNIRSLLGITQEELALLLKVTRSQLSLYELGQRDLPAPAKQQLAKMLQFMQEDVSTQDIITPVLKKQIANQKKVLEQMLQNNQYKQLLLEKKSVTAEKKYHSNLTAIQLMKFLKKEDTKNELLKVIESKATAEIEKNGLAVLTKYHIEKEVLRAEEKMLRKFLGV